MNTYKPTCGKCGGVMTPADSHVRPELFLHDACLPEELAGSVDRLPDDMVSPLDLVSPPLPDALRATAVYFARLAEVTSNTTRAADYRHAAGLMGAAADRLEGAVS